MFFGKKLDFEIQLSLIIYQTRLISNFDNHKYNLPVVVEQKINNKNFFVKNLNIQIVAQ